MNKNFLYIKDRFLLFTRGEKGMGVIEIVLIILVLVGLALVFKNQITGMADGIYKSIKGQINSF